MLFFDRITELVAPKEADAYRRARVRFAIASSLILSVVGWVRSVQIALLGNRPQSILLATCALGAMCVPFLLRRTRSLELAGHVLSLLLFVVLARAALVSGLSGSPALVAMSIVPLGSTFIAGQRAGYVWAGIVAVVIVTFGVLDHVGLSLESLPPSTVRWATSTGAMLMTIMNLTLALAYQRTHRMVTTTLETVREESAVFRARASAVEEERRARLARLMDALASEGNNTIASVVTNIAYAETEIDKQEAKEALADAYVSASRLTEILANTRLLLAPPEAQRSDDVDVAAVVHQVVEEARPMLDRLAIRVSCDVPERPVLAAATAAAIRLALRNLIGRIAPESTLAISVTNDPPRIEVESSGRPGELGLEATSHVLATHFATFSIAYSRASWKATITLIPTGQSAREIATH